MVVMMRVRNGGQPVVDSMGCRQAAALKAHAAQVRVGFDNALKRRGDDVLFGRQHRFFSLLKQRVVAQLGKRQRGLGAFAARHGGGTATRAGARFKPGGQRIANAGCQQARRGARHNLRVDDNDIRVVRQHQVAVELAAVGINHRKRAARRVGGGDGRRDSDRHRHKVRQRFCGIERFTAADAQHSGTAGAVGELTQPVDFILRAFAAKRRDFDAKLGLFKALAQRLFCKTEHEFIPDDQPAFGQRF